jgi:hypothetical protein
MDALQEAITGTITQLNLCHTKLVFTKQASSRRPIATTDTVLLWLPEWLLERTVLR